jgi:hypothetical protein
LSDEFQLQNLLALINAVYSPDRYTAPNFLSVQYPPNMGEEYETLSNGIFEVDFEKESNTAWCYRIDKDMSEAAGWSPDDIASCLPEEGAPRATTAYRTYAGGF